MIKEVMRSRCVNGLIHMSTHCAKDVVEHNQKIFQSASDHSVDHKDGIGCNIDLFLPPWGDR